LMLKGEYILVILEAADAERDGINGDLLGEGCRIAAELGTELKAVSLADRGIFPGMDNYGLSTLFEIDAKGNSDYSRDLLVGLLKKIPRPGVLLFPASDSCRVLAPQVAHKLGSAAIIDVVDVRVRDGRLFYVKQCYSGNFEQEIRYDEGALEVAAVVRTALEPAAGSKPFERVAVPIDAPDDGRVKSLGITPPDFQTVDIIYAGTILGVGMGCADANTMKTVRELSELLEASLGTTRPVVDEGYLPKTRMIGMTGKTVTPDFYLTLGISGSPHHIAGIQKAKKIVSVNKDPGAPIFQSSDVGFIADITEVIPQLNARIQKWQRDRNEKI
jgi:electron transfer flavoprotein alpha subunit